MNVEEKASEVIAKWNAGDPNRTAGLFITDLLHLHELIRDAIAASRPPTGHIIDETGAVRRVLGTLPVTADGCVVGHKCGRSYSPPSLFYIDGSVIFTRPDWHSSFPGYDKCYSTSAAAEAARGAEG